MNKNVVRLSFSVIMLLLANCNLMSQAPATPTNPALTPAVHATASPTDSPTAIPIPTGAPSPAPTATPTPQPSGIISSDNARNLVEIATWGQGSGHHPTYSPDGGLIAVSSSSGIYLYDSQTLQERLYFAPTARLVLEMAFSPDSQTLSAVMDGSDYTVTQWDLASGSELHRWSVHSNSLNDIVSLAPDGKTLAIGFDENTTKLLDMASGNELLTLNTSYLANLAFSPDGKILASAASQKVTLWDVSSGSQLRTLDPGPTGPGTYASLVFSPDGRTLAVGAIYSAFQSDDNTIVWDVASGRELLRFATPIVSAMGSTGFSLAFSPDGKTLASGSADAIKLWDAAGGNELLTWNASHLESLAFSPDGKTLVSASSVGNDSVKLWDAATGDLLNTLTGDNVYGEAIFSADSSTLAYASSDSTVILRDVTSGEVRRLSGHPGMVWSLAFSPDGKSLASGSFHDYRSPPNNLLKLWDVASGQELRTLNGHLSLVQSLAFSPDGKTLASGSDDENIKLWDVASGSEVRTLSGNTGLVYSLAFSPDGKTLASAYYDATGATVTLWDVASGSDVRTLSGNPEDEGLSLAFTPDGKVLVARNYYGYDFKHLWDVASGQELHNFGGDPDALRSVAFSPDSKTLATGLEDGTLKLWDIASGQELYSLSGHAKAVAGLAFSPDGKLFASAGGNSIKLWDVASGQELASLSTGDVFSLVFSPDGELILSRSPGGMRRLWGVQP